MSHSASEFRNPIFSATAITLARCTGGGKTPFGQLKDYVRLARQNGNC